MTDVDQGIGGAQPVSVILTVLNEASASERLLESLAAQTYPADEVVVVDGGSTDGTIEVLDRWAGGGRLPLRILVHPGANISAGRNAAIAAASGPIIAVTDAGVRLEPDWLKELVAPFQAGERAAVPAVAGWFVADP